MNTFSCLNLRRITTVFALALFFTCPASAQWHGDGVQRPESYIAVSGLTHMPELHTDMPLDCLIGYIAMDSIARTGGIQDVLTAADQTSLSELRALSRFIYGMADYDPILLNRHFLSTMDSSYPNGNYQSYYANSYSSVIRGVHKRKEEFGRDYAMLIIANYILHVRVANVHSGIDSITFNPDREEWTNIACEVQEIYKGKRLPDNCASTPHVMKKGREKTLGGLPCLIYGHLTSSGYVPQPDDEMVIFLNLVLDKENLFLVYPRFGLNETGGRFIIRNGRIDDPDNTWGLGTNPAFEDFRTTLLKKIDDVRSWTE